MSAYRRELDWLHTCTKLTDENAELQAQLTTARNDALDEAAKLCDVYSTNHGAGMFDIHSSACADEIRDLKTKATT
jgi:hypothetical protein